jgi:hypothetical protein
MSEPIPFVISWQRSDLVEEVVLETGLPKVVCQRIFWMLKSWGFNLKTIHNQTIETYVPSPEQIAEGRAAALKAREESDSLTTAGFGR